MNVCPFANVTSAIGMAPSELRHNADCPGPFTRREGSLDGRAKRHRGLAHGVGVPLRGPEIVATRDGFHLDDAPGLRVHDHLGERGPSEHVDRHLKRLVFDLELG